MGSPDFIDLAAGCAGKGVDMKIRYTERHSVNKVVVPKLFNFRAYIYDDGTFEVEHPDSLDSIRFTATELREFADAAEMLKFARSRPDSLLLARLRRFICGRRGGAS